MNARERVVRKRLRDDLPYYAAKCLRIRTKAGEIRPFVLNAPQHRIHRWIEDHRHRRGGRVRVLVLKARQWGCSTYVEGRIYHKVAHRFGARAYILTHALEATDAIFQMAQRFHEHCPQPVRPSTGRSNTKELRFDKLDSGFEVGTAGSRAVGRGRTIQLFHGSEVAFWPNAQEHVAGALQAVPDAPGTEVILESTANGVGGAFHEMCLAALRGEGEYELLFVPWFWHDEYRRPPSGDWVPSSAWAEYARLHDLDREQAYWAWRKNGELAQAISADPSHPCWTFRQEYPATVEEAFQMSWTESFIRPELVTAARKRTVADQSHAPLLLGVDVARGGRDKTRIIDRLGRCAGYHVNRKLDADDLMEVTGVVAWEIDRLRPDMTFIDVTGLGAGVADRLKERGYRKVLGVNFGAKAQEAARYANKRAEMWGRMRDWFADPGGVDIPDDDELHTHLCAPTASFDSCSRTVLEKKEEIRKRLGASPDAADALALTFAETVRRHEDSERRTAQAEIDYDPLRRNARHGPAG